MKRVVFRPEARVDALDAYRWYENQRPGLGREFREALDRAINSLGDQPKSFPVIHRDARRALLKRFPYMVFYRDIESMRTSLSSLP
jgi:plasmid stabilization system protein ParE